jgi:hypothetical protein
MKQKEQTAESKLQLTELAKQWLEYNYRGDDLEDVEILPMLSVVGPVVYFYYFTTGKDLPYFLTVPMCEELLAGKNPKKIKNQYLHKREENG